MAWKQEPIVQCRIACCIIINVQPTPPHPPFLFLFVSIPHQTPNLTCWAPKRKWIGRHHHHDRRRRFPLLPSPSKPPPSPTQPPPATTRSRQKRKGGRSNLTIIIVDRTRIQNRIRCSNNRNVFRRRRLLRYGQVFWSFSLPFSQITWQVKKSRICFLFSPHFPRIQSSFCLWLDPPPLFSFLFLFFLTFKEKKTNLFTIAKWFLGKKASESQRRVSRVSLMKNCLQLFQDFWFFSPFSIWKGKSEKKKKVCCRHLGDFYFFLFFLKETFN